MAARACFVQVGESRFARAVLDASQEFVPLLANLQANAVFAAKLAGVCKVDCKVEVSTARDGDWCVMDGPENLETLHPGIEPLWIRVTLPPPAGELFVRMRMLLTSR